MIESMNSLALVLGWTVITIVLLAIVCFIIMFIWIVLEDMINCWKNLSNVNYPRLVGDKTKLKPENTFFRKLVKCLFLLPYVSFRMVILGKTNVLVATRGDQWLSRKETVEEEDVDDEWEV